ncbi:MAG: cytochrome c [Chloroflexi bacterium]|nr:cytochrome c [Chloroflexota bacterium]
MINPVRLALAFLGVLTVFILSPRILAAAEGEALFAQKCQSCHTIGGGRTVGPDLKGITTKRDTAWLVSFISEPDRLIAQGDPIAKEIVAEYGLPMPNVGVSPDEARAILSYIETESADDSPAASPVPVTPLSGDAGRGRALFTGEMPFRNGGASCLSCHNVSGVGAVGGGTVGKDLTGAYASFGEAGLNAIMKSAPFPMMKEVYGSRQLGDEEIADVTAFLGEAGASPPDSQNPAVLFAASIGGAVLIIGAFQLAWRRLTGVRRRLVKGGSN